MQAVASAPLLRNALDGGLAAQLLADASRRRLAFYLDYDGTLAPIVDQPDRAFISEETRDESASAIWSLSTDNAPNKDTIAKLGGVDPLIGLLVGGATEKSQDIRAAYDLIRRHRGLS